MKKIMIVLFISIEFMYGSATYTSLTDFTSRDGYTGFREQVMNVPKEDLSGSDIILGKEFNLPYNISLIDQTSQEAQKLLLKDIDFCTNGMTRIKVYIPPHIKAIQIAMQVLPINYAIAFATFQPIGEINENNAQDFEELFSNYYVDKYDEILWKEHKTVMFTVNGTASLNINENVMEKYGIDNSKGGYLYLSFTQAPAALASARDYDPRYSLSMVLYVDFKKPFTDAMRQDVLSRIPSGVTEPAEVNQHLMTRECNAPFEFDIETEQGETLTPAEQCTNGGGTYINNLCYYLPSDQEKYECEVIEREQWNDSRCVMQEERDCNAQTDTKWYITGESCLYLEDQISTSDTSTLPTPREMISEHNETAYKLSFYEVNSENWSTVITVKNESEHAETVHKIMILDDQSSEKLVEFDFNVTNSDIWIGKLFSENGQLLLAAPKVSSDTELETIIASRFAHKGIVIVQPDDVENMIDNNKTIVEMKSAYNLFEPVPLSSSSSSSSSSSATPVVVSEYEKQCVANGGVYVAETGDCYGANTQSSISSSSSSSSPSYVSSSSSSIATVPVVVSEYEKQCVVNGGVYVAETGDCYGANAQSSISSSSSSSSHSYASSSSSSIATVPVVVSEYEKQCVLNGGVYVAETGDCYGANTQSSISSSSSSSSSVSSAIGNSSSADASSSSVSSLPSTDDSVYSITAVVDAISGKTFDIDGYFAEYDFNNDNDFIDDPFDWTFQTPSGAVYQLRGNEPTAKSVFGWKRVNVTPATSTYIMVYIGDWDHDGKGQYDWIVINEKTKTVYKLLGVNENGTFEYHPDEINIGMSIEGDSIKFDRKQPGT